MQTIEEPQCFAPQPLRYCSDCGAVMLLARVTPAFWVMPELQTFRCPQCGNVFTWEIDVGAAPH
jgi:predicted RNA-binding Zn-ribbon protein involved in translation (DUF1610 family)